MIKPEFISMVNVKYQVVSARKTQEEVVKLLMRQPSNKDLNEVLINDLLGGFFKYWVQEKVSITKLKPQKRAQITPSGSTSIGPIIVDKKYNIIDGNHRYYAAKNAGEDKIEILRPGPYEQ